MHTFGIWLIAGALAGAAVTDDFIATAKEKHGEFGEKAARFLVDNMPAGDRDGLEVGFLTENLDLALKARETFPWAKAVPEAIFLNDVLPYAVFDEPRDRWRADFFAKATPLVMAAKSCTEAAQVLNREFFKLTRTHYDTGRKRTNQSPLESIEQGKATCTGLSILLVDACRAVGIPARAVGTPLWMNGSGNHTWVEIWDGDWHFTGADEYDAKGLDRGWFTKEAAQADAAQPAHAIYATSWKKEGLSFPMVWAEDATTVAAVNVAARYASKSVTAKHSLGIRYFEGENRQVVKGWLTTEDGRVLAEFETKAGTADLNDLPRVEVVPGTRYRLRFHTGGGISESAPFTADPGANIRDVHPQELAPLPGKTRESQVSPMSQRAYVWQREWKPSVMAAIARSRHDLTGYAILACEIEWRNGLPHEVIPRIDWPALGKENGSLSPVIRVMPRAGPFSDDDETARFLCDTARRQLAIFQQAGITPHELQLDFDCAQKKLAGYAKWVRAVRRAISPVPLVITALPCWLDEPEFPVLVRAASSYVLQVHSVAAVSEKSAMVCDPALARRWVERASRIGVPFEISLPTYRTVAGYDSQGKKIGAYSDAIRPAWPPGTAVREYATDLDAMAALVAEWCAHRPQNCTGLMWYRLPVDGDRQNCPWPALRAMIQGRPPVQALQVRVNGQEPGEQEPTTLADFSLVNTGETDELLLTEITVKWEPPATLVMAEPLPGWRVTQGSQEMIFKPILSSVRLPSGASRAIGWLRFNQPTRTFLDVTHAYR